jgi:beta-lactamase class A
MRRSAWLLALLAVWLTPPATLLADDVGEEGVIRVPTHQPSPWDAIDDPVIRDMLALDAIAPFEDTAPLWKWKDKRLQKQVDQALVSLQLDDDARRRQLAVTLVDVSDPKKPRVAEVNGDTMIDAASLPKIAVLLGAFEKIAQGKMEYTPEIKGLMEQMIQRSNNRSTTEMMHRTGKKYIARVLLSPRYRLYDPRHGGGLWVGKDYAKSGLWKRDPLHNLSHAATAIQVARFYYMLYTDNLVTPEWCREMRNVMSGAHIDHKFVKALRQLAPRMLLLRKSGSWRTYHSDSALVSRDGKTYIAVALSNSAEGSDWMGEIITEFDKIVMVKR